MSLLPEQVEYVAEQVADGVYSSASEYVRDLIQRDQRSRTLSELERKLLEGLDSGPAEPADRTFFAGLRARAARKRTPKAKRTRRGT